MRWISKEPEKIALGARKVVSYFAWFPVTFYRETRWLEIVSVTKVYSSVTRCTTRLMIEYKINKWVSYNFTDKIKS